MRVVRFVTRARETAIHQTSLVDSYRREAVHLFRALLRQCTYLPDPAARKYLHFYVVSRFREYAPRFPIGPQQIRKPLQIITQRRQGLLKKARKGVTFLGRANHGHIHHLGKVFAMTYGRIGKRKHLLLQSLKAPDVPVDSEALEKLAQPEFRGVPRPSQQLIALLKSQQMRKDTFFSNKPIKQIQPNIPETNSWGRPMPMKRVRNIRRRWYAEALDRTMPPLPAKEWESLRKLAAGEVILGRPARRKSQSEREEVGSAGFMTGQNYLSRPHELTPRYLRRLWAKIFLQCPLMTRNDSKQSGWDISWGDVEDDANTVLGPGGQLGNTLFEGVDDRGKVMAPTST